MFSDQIKAFIEHAHVFIPFITGASSRRGWVHQEIGYARALNIPVLPLAMDRLPGGLLEGLEAVHYSSDPETLARSLGIDAIRKTIDAQKASKPLYCLAEHPEHRTEMMVSYAGRVIQMEARGHVRQKGGLSSFNIPDEIPEAVAWKHRYGVHYRPNRCERQREERQVLGEHARAEGCSLIVDESLTFENYGPLSKPARLRTLMAFLDSMPDDAVRVATVRPERSQHHLTIVGDWFAAEAVSAAERTGIAHTIFTRHGPTVRKKIVEFDEELEHHLRQQGIAPERSKSAALSRLGRVLKETGG